MLKLKEGQTKKEYWNKRNGIRLKLSKFIQSLNTKEYEDYMLGKELQYLKSAERLLEQLLSNWKDNKDTINRALEVNKDAE